MASDSRWFSDDHQIFRKGFRKFVETELAPHADEWEEAEIFPRELFKRMGELGYFGIRYPEEHGGLGGDVWYMVAMCEEYPRCLTAGLPMAMMVQAEMATNIISKVGTDEQIETFLKPALSGDKIAAL